MVVGVGCGGMLIGDGRRRKSQERLVVNVSGEGLSLD